jgi:hypothetical protein
VRFAGGWIVWPRGVMKERTNTMLAYHNDAAGKAVILAQLQAHRDADQIIQGVYWENGKGCAVGCTIHSGKHAEYEPRFGIPQVLARLEDRIFEGLPNAVAKDWPLRFMAAIRPGAELSKVWPQFAAWLLVDDAHGVIRFAKTDEQRDVMRDIAGLYLKGETDREVWRALWLRASKIRGAAAAAAYAAAAGAADAYAYAAAAAAAYAYAAAAAAADAYAYAAAYAAYSARQRHFVAQADKLVLLLEAA